MALVFSGADVMCATGDPTYSTPYLLAQRAGQKLQMEFLHQNKLSGKQVMAIIKGFMLYRKKNSYKISTCNIDITKPCNHRKTALSMSHLLSACQ